MSIWLPDTEQVLLIHERLVHLTGGSGGIRDIGLIESALARARAAFEGVEAHPGLLGKAAAICCGLTQNHGFVDGNKRIGITTMLFTLQRNDVQLRYTQDELVQLGLAVAQNLYDVSDVEDWLKNHIAK